MNRRQFLSTTTAAILADSAGAAGSVPTNSDELLRVGVIGDTGRGDYGHGLEKMWLQIPETTIVAVADVDPEGLKSAMKKLKAPQGFADYRDMLKDTNPDIVAICPRFVDQRRDMILAAVNAGVRGIYVEKPFCRNPDEADEILLAIKQHGVKVAVAHRASYHPVLPILSTLIQNGAVGRVLEIRARGKEDHRGGPLDLWVLGSHLLDLATTFAGKPVACSATVLQDGRAVTKTDVKEGSEGVGPIAGNQVHARFDTESGYPLFFDSIKDAGVKAAGFGLQIIGTEGVIDLRPDLEPVAHLREGNPFQPVSDRRAWVPVTTAGVGNPEPTADLKKLIVDHVIPGRDLIAAIREGRQPLCGANDGAMTIEMICAVFESHRLGGQRVKLPLETRTNPFSVL